MNRLFGIETEYGIIVEGLGASDWIDESIAVVRSVPGPSVGGWNYRGEDPRRDMRGYVVTSLTTNPEDSLFDLPSRKPMSREEERSDRILANGARFYNDHGHPEYATPECRSIKDLIAHDKAGERIAFSAAERRAEQSNRSVSLYKNNTDFHGSSYGTHESYLMRRDTHIDLLIAALIPFFVTRQIYAGAGKCGLENCGREDPDRYQISQRADYFSVEASVDTLHNRPLVNTRDEPHTTPSKYRRLHVICGDANMSEYSTGLKIGTTSLVLSLIEDGWTPCIALKEAVKSARTVSRDISLTQQLEMEGGGTLKAIDIQRIYLDEAAKRYSGKDSDTDWTLAEWAFTLNMLESNPMQLSDRLDWVAKFALLNPFRLEEELKWNDPHMQSLDLAYHDINPETGLYYGLEHEGTMRRLVTDGRIDAAMNSAPCDTRAFLRGLMVNRFGGSIEGIGWNGILFRHNEETMLFDMNPLVEENVTVLNEEFQSLQNLDQVIANLRQQTKEGLN